jgi:hypothetical protein
MELYANPYSYDCQGFYFNTPKQFDKKYDAAYKKTGCEEYELEFIDGTREEGELFEAMQVGSANLHAWFDLMDDLEDYELPAMYYLIAVYGEKDWNRACKLVDDEVRTMEGSAKDYAYDYLDNIGGVSELSKEARVMYFDYAQFGRDLKMDLDPDNPDDEFYLNMNDAEAGEEYVESAGGVEALGDTAERYFDVDSWARDMELGGDINVFDFAGTEYVTDYHG